MKKCEMILGYQKGPMNKCREEIVIDSKKYIIRRSRYLKKRINSE